jgi:enediyne biosynthesis protein E7
MHELELPLPPSLGDNLDLDTIRQAPIRFLEEGVRQCGDIFRYESAGWSAAALNHPDYAKHVLLTNVKNFTKLGTPDLMLLKPLLGEGLMTSVDAPWQQQRQMLQSAFRRHQINAYLPYIVDATDALLRRWEQATDTGVPIDLVAEMGRLSLHIAAQCFFGTDMEDEAIEFGRAFATMSTFLAAFDPTNMQGMLHYQRARLIISTFIRRVVETRRQTGVDNGDVLSMLLHASEADGNAALAERQIQDQVLTLLVGGGETTGQALGWTLYLLDRHPDALTCVQAEVDGALGGRARIEDTLDQLNVTWMAIQEAMRLYPPVWLMSRMCRVDDVVGRFRIPAGTLVIVSPFMLHRHPDFWAEPQVFDPERFLPERVAASAPYAYLPFSCGPRVCIGQAFARVATCLVLAMIVHRFRLKLVPDHPVEPEGTVVTLRPKYGLPMTLHARY